MNNMRTTPWRTWLSLAVLVLAAVFSFIDRQILSLMVTPIKQDLGINDVQVGLLQGFAFAMFYSLAAIPLGWLADRSSRKWIISIGVAVWSLMTALCGLAHSFLQLFLARMGVGVGEATLSACGHSVIADMFDKERLPLAMSIYGTGVSLGAGVAFIGGGYLVELLNQLGGINLFGSELAAWQAAFIVVGLPGVLVAVMLAIVMKEPARSKVTQDAQQRVEGFDDFVRTRFSLVWRFILGIGMLTAAGYANLAWLPSYFERTFGWNTAQAGTTIGVLLLFLAMPGGVACGLLAQRWLRRGREDAAMRIMVLTSLAAGPIMCLAFLMPTPPLVIFLMIIPMAIGSSFVGLGPASAQAVTPGQFRGRVAAFQLLLTSLIGMISGPLIVGSLTQYVFADPDRIGWSLAITAPLLNLAGAALLASALPAYRKALQVIKTTEVRQDT